MTGVIELGSLADVKKPRRRSIGLRIVAATCSIIAVTLIVSWFVAGALIAPMPRVIGDAPKDLQASSFAINSESGSRIRGWHHRAGGQRGVIVLVHGIGSSRLTMLGRARMLKERGYSTVMIDLQGHGESSGKCITIGYLERHDVRAAVEYARREHPKEPIGVIGVSLGGAATLLASPLGVDAIVAESVYPDIDDAVRNRVTARLGMFGLLPAELLLLQLEPRLGVSRTQLRPIDHIAEVGCPIFVISGVDDLHTTTAETKAMFARARNEKELWLVEHAAHIDLFAHSPKEYREKVAYFFQRHFLHPNHTASNLPP